MNENCGNCHANIGRTYVNSTPSQPTLHVITSVLCQYNVKLLKRGKRQTEIWKFSSDTTSDNISRYVTCVRCVLCHVLAFNTEAHIRHTATDMNARWRCCLALLLAYLEHNGTDVKDGWGDGFTAARHRHGALRRVGQHLARHLYRRTCRLQHVDHSHSVIHRRAIEQKTLHWCWRYLSISSKCS